VIKAKWGTWYKVFSVENFLKFFEKVRNFPKIDVFSKNKSVYIFGGVLDTAYAKDES